MGTSRSQEWRGNVWDKNPKAHEKRPCPDGNDWVPWIALLNSALFWGSYVRPAPIIPSIKRHANLHSTFREEERSQIHSHPRSQSSIWWAAGPCKTHVFYLVFYSTLRCQLISWHPIWRMQREAVQEIVTLQVISGSGTWPRFPAWRFSAVVYCAPAAVVLVTTSFLCRNSHYFQVSEERLLYCLVKTSKQELCI